MLRSLYSGISGLKNHQIKMDVVGNNIANVNTTGFKRSSVTFATMLSQNLRGASTPTENQGGTNAQQIGLGVSLGAINQIMTQGSAQSTGTTTDLMLQGSGFFVMDNSGQKVYTRAGGFLQDRDGYLEDPSTGAKVQGFSWGQDDSMLSAWGDADVGSIKFALGDKLAMDNSMPVATTSVLLNDSPTIGTYTAEAAGPPVVAATYCTDPLGVANMTIEGMTKVSLSTTPSTGQFTFNPETGTVTFATGFVIPTTGLNMTYVDPAVALVDTTNTNIVTVDYPPKFGAIVYNDATGTPIPYKLASSAIPGDGEYAVKDVNGKYQIIFGTDGTGADTIASTSISYDFTNAPHTLTGFSIDQNGVITGVYGNGVDSVTHKIAQIAVAKFTNDAGLANLGGSFYSTTPNSGEPSIGAASQDGRAAIIPSTVEMSNSNLAQEFTDMIVTQRGFQANSKVITTSDSLLQELIDLKR